MSEIKRIDKNSRLSEAVVFGSMVYVSGQVDSQFHRTVYDQTRSVLAMVEDLLERVGTDKEHILCCTVYLSNIGAFQEMNKAWEDWVSKDNPPARSVVQTELPDPRWLIQVSTIAVLKNKA